MPDASDVIDLSAVALFPLPGVVLFPRAVLPLHIFEDRYRAMTADALTSSKQLAMALLKPGWEKSYYGKPAIEPVVCVGQILSHEKLADGKYNFLLQGIVRARIVRELQTDRPYRVAELQRLEVVPAMEIDLEDHRRRMTEVFLSTPLGASGAGRQFSQIVKSHLPTVDVADLVAFTFLEDAAMKQSVLAEIDVRARVERIVSELEAVARKSRPSLHAPSGGDPSVN